MIEKKLWQSIVDAVPQWYTAETGPNKTLLTVGDVQDPFYSSRGFTPALSRLYHTAEDRAGKWLEAFSESGGEAFQAHARESFQQTMALKWLRVANDEAYEDVDWSTLLSYVQSLRYRTYENEPIPLNLIVGPGEGRERITEERLQKTLDPLLSTPQVYMRTDFDLRFREYGETRWEDVEDTADYKFHPEFLQPLASSLGEGEVGVHLTRRGDFIVIDEGGLLASWRKGQWHLYDASTLKNSIVDAMSGTHSAGVEDGVYRVGCNLFEIAFDLSYRRHGALLIYDPDGKTADHLLNSESLLDGSDGRPGDGQAMLAPSIYDIKMSAREHKTRRKRLFTELASMDGAVVFTDDEIIAFGAMVAPNDSTGDFPGARTKAAWSALEWGGRPVKVSEDGDVEVLFRSEGSNGETCAASMSFL